VKTTILTVLRFLALTVLYFVCFAVISGTLLSSASEQPAPSEAGAALAGLLVLSLLNTAVLVYVILRSRWTGWKLILSLVFVFYGVTTLMSQIETAFFVTRLPPGMLPRLFLAGALMAVVFVPLAVLILGKARANETPDHTVLQMPASVWIIKLSLIIIAYVVIYFSFGYFIAWQSPAVRAYYGGSDPGSFVRQIASVWRDTPLLFLLQAARALLWAAIAVPVIKMMKGKWWEGGLAVALLFTVVMNTQLLLPNPLMPTEVRMAHLVETATSNFLFAWLLVVILRWPLRQAS
jgi:hypothetical protein